MKPISMCLLCLSLTFRYLSCMMSCMMSYVAVVYFHVCIMFHCIAVLQFIYSSVERNSAYFHFLVLLNIDALNILVPVS